MHAITRHLRRAIALVAILTTILAAVPLAASAQDTVDERKEQCKHGGWQTLASADGTPFANQGDCVSYIATGGSFGETDTGQEEPPVDPPSTGPSMVVTLYTAYEGGCAWSLDLSGFPGGQEVTVYADEAGVEFDPLYGNYVEPFTIVTDTDGNAHRSQDQASVMLDGLTSYVFTVSQGESIITQHTVYCGWDGNDWINQG